MAVLRLLHYRALFEEVHHVCCTSLPKRVMHIRYARKLSKLESLLHLGCGLYPIYNTIVSETRFVFGELRGVSNSNLDRRRSYR